jgi:Skp family chaperone for outer membrane proteins
MTSSLIPDSLHSVKESWRLLQNKIGDTVLERGVLLAHPQDSYEVLEERLLEALELPVRPRAKILKCGHYMGPVESDAASSDDEHGQSWAVEKRDARDWCDVCRRNVRLEDMGEMEGLDKRFRIKIYASNGLMRAGAWAAAWKEMERVDVEIEPLVEANLHDDLERLAIAMATEESPEEQHQEEDDGFIDEDMMIENVPHHDDHDTQDQERHEAEIRMREEEVRSRMAEEEEMRQKMADDEHLRQLRLAEEEETKKRLEEEERQKINRMAEELGIRQRMNRDEGMRRSILEADRMRDVYDREPLTPDRHEMPRQTPSHRGTRGDESLSELLIAAFKVAIRDSRNVAIVVLSSFVLLLALRPASPSHNPAPIIMNESPAVAQVTTTVFTEVVTTATHSVAPVVANPPPVIELSPGYYHRNRGRTTRYHYHHPREDRD